MRPKVIVTITTVPLPLSGHVGQLISRFVLTPIPEDADRVSTPQELAALISQGLFNEYEVENCLWHWGGGYR